MKEDSKYEEFLLNELNVPVITNTNYHILKCNNKSDYTNILLNNEIMITNTVLSALRKVKIGDVIAVANQHQSKINFYHITNVDNEKVYLTFNNSEEIEYIEPMLINSIPKTESLVVNVNELGVYFNQSMYRLYKEEDVYKWKIKVCCKSDINAESLYGLLDFLFNFPNVNVSDFVMKIRVQSPGTILLTTTKTKAITAIIFAFTALNNIKNKSISKLQNLVVGIGNTKEKYSSIVTDMRNTSNKAKLYVKDQLKDSKKIIRIRALNAEALTFNELPLPKKEILDEVKYRFNKLSKSVAGVINTKEIVAIQEDMNKNLMAYFLSDLKTMTPKQLKKFSMKNLTADVRSIYENFAANKLDDLIDKNLEKRIVPQILKDLTNKLTIEEKEKVISLLREKARGQLFDHFEYQMQNYADERVIKQAHLLAKEALKKRHFQKKYEELPEIDELASKSVIRKKIRTERS